MSLLEVSGLSVRFPTRQGTVQAVLDVDFSIEKGEVLGVVGESGSGKSVIAASILRILPPSAEVQGKILFLGADIRGMNQETLRELRSRDIALVPQNPGSSLNPLLTNGFQVDEVYVHQGISPRDARRRTLSVLKGMFFEDPELVSRQYPHQISGGMQQRVVTAIGTAKEPSLIVADEPTKGLDSLTRAMSRDLFRDIIERYQAAMLLITHDLLFAEEVCDRVSVMYAGEFVETGSAGEVLNDPQHPYTQGLMKARPDKGLVPLPGSSPDLIRLPVGCHFQDRCLYCSEDCRRFHPAMEIGTGRGVRCYRCS